MSNIKWFLLWNSNSITRLNTWFQQNQRYQKCESTSVHRLFSEDIAKVLKIKGNTSNTGELVDVDKIAFNNTKNVFLVCDQIDSTLINNRDSNTVMAAACVNEIIPFEKPMPTARFRSNYHQHLTFHIKDDQGNNLPIRRVFYRLLINKPWVSINSKKNCTHR